MSDLYDVLGNETRKKLMSSRAWVLAQLVGEALYNGGTEKVWKQSRKFNSQTERWEDDGDKPDAASGHVRFISSKETHIPSWVPKHIVKEITGNAAAEFIPTERLLRELAHELERVAVKENT